jgi:putative ABC transport system permease protein
MRIFLQNITGYFVLAVGIGFVMLMLAMAVGMPDTLSWYQKHAGEMMLSEYQLMLTSDHDEDGDPIETDVGSAEKFSIAELTAESGSSVQSVNTYGVEEDSTYAKVPSGLVKGEVCVSSAYSGKFGTETGDTIELSEKYGYKSYRFKVAGILEYDGGVAVFMDIDNFNRIFDRDEGSYNGFFSAEEIKDIDDDYIAAVISSEDIIKMTAQLDHSMGAYMLYFQYLCLMLSAVLIFLLTKVILERSEKSISMVKILGYSNREIASLYIVTTTAVVILSETVTAFAAKKAMVFIWNGMMSRMEGYFPFVITKAGMLRMLALVFAGYLIVMLIDFRRIKRISMDEALKNIE